jgi:hypothetical protein
MDTRTGAGASAPGAGVRLAWHDDDVGRLQDEGLRLHIEEQRLRAERAVGVVDWEAHRRFAAALRAHQERLRRFRAGRQAAAPWRGPLGHSGAVVRPTGSVAHPGRPPA